MKSGRQRTSKQWSFIPQNLRKLPNENNDGYIPYRLAGGVWKIHVRKNSRSVRLILVRGPVFHGDRVIEVNTGWIELIDWYQIGTTAYDCRKKNLIGDAKHHHVEINELAEFKNPRLVDLDSFDDLFGPCMACIFAVDHPKFTNIELCVSIDYTSTEFQTDTRSDKPKEPDANCNFWNDDKLPPLNANRQSQTVTLSREWLNRISREPDAIDFDIEERRLILGWKSCEIDYSSRRKLFDLVLTVSSWDRISRFIEKTILLFGKIRLQQQGELVREASSMAINHIRIHQSGSVDLYFNARWFRGDQPVVRLENCRWKAEAKDYGLWR